MKTLQLSRGKQTSLNQIYHHQTHPVNPETSIRRQSGMSIFRQEVAIKKRTSQDTCIIRAYPDFGVTRLLAAGSR